jgi:hypothetical protein
MSAIVASAGVLSASLSAQPRSDLEAVDSLVAKADLIVAGVEEAANETGRTSIRTNSGLFVKRQMSVTLSVDRVLKGVLKASTVRFQWETGPVPLSIQGNGRVPTMYSVFFLKHVGNEYSLVSPFSFSIIAAPTTRAAHHTAIDQVAAVIGAVIRAKESTAPDKTQAVGVLRSATSLEANAALQFALADPDPSIRFRAAAALLDKNDMAPLPMVEDALLHPAKQDAQHLTVLRSAMERGMENPAAIASLARIMAAGDVGSRVWAAWALRNTGSRRAIPFLARGLTDDYFEVRYWAVLGLAEITGDKVRSAIGKGRDTEGEQYVNYWIAWAHSRGLIR